MIRIIYVTFGVTLIVLSVVQFLLFLTQKKMSASPIYSREDDPFVDDMLTHWNTHIVHICARRNALDRFEREQDFQNERCSCCNQPEREFAHFLVNVEVSDDLVYLFSRVLNTANEKGLCKKVDLFFRIGELAMVVDYTSPPGAVPYYLWDPERKIRMCGSCYYALSVKIETFREQHGIVELVEDFIKEPEV